MIVVPDLDSPCSTRLTSCQSPCYHRDQGFVLRPSRDQLNEYDQSIKYGLSSPPSAPRRCHNNLPHSEQTFRYGVSRQLFVLIQ